jgi:hypothetical protein
MRSIVQATYLCCGYFVQLRDLNRFTADSSIFVFAQKIVERYSRNVAKDANDDIAEVIFNMAEEKVSVTYHRDNSKISATTREFIKPTAADDKGAGGISWNVDNHTAYLVSLCRDVVMS